MINPYKIIKYPLSTEKAVKDMEASNTLSMIVDSKATKSQIKWAVQKAFDVRVVKVSTLITPKGKKAYIRLHADTPAIDVTTKLGLV